MISACRRVDYRRAHEARVDVERVLAARTHVVAVTRER
jgi:hypothetical protein